MSDPYESFVPDPYESFVPDEAPATAKPSPDVFPADKVKEQDSAWQQSEHRNELNDSVDPAGMARAALGGFYPYAAHLAGVDPGVYSEAIKHHPMAHLVGQLGQQYGLSRLFPSVAGASLGRKAATYGLQSAAGQAMDSTNTNPDNTVEQNLPSTLLAGVLGALGGPLVEKGVSTATGGLANALEQRSVAGLSDDISKGVGSMLDYLGYTGEERTRTLLNTKALREILDQYKDFLPSFMNRAKNVLQKAGDRVASTSLARQGAEDSLVAALPDIPNQNISSSLGARINRINAPGGNPADADAINILKGQYDISPTGSTPTSQVIGNIKGVAGGDFGAAGSSVKPKGISWAGTGAEREALGGLNEAIDMRAADVGVDTAPYHSAVDRARQASNFHTRLSDVTSTQPTTPGGFSLNPKQVGFELAKKMGASRFQSMAAGARIGGIEKAYVKLQNIAEGRGGTLAGIDPVEIGRLRGTLEKIMQTPKQEWPAMDYVLMSTNPAYMALKREMDNE